MSEEVKNLIEKLKDFHNEVHAPFEKHPIVRDKKQFKAIIESSPEMKEALRQVKKDENKLKSFIEETFQSDLERIEKLEEENKDLVDKIAGYSDDDRKKVLDKLNKRIEIFQKLEREELTNFELTTNETQQIE